MPRDYAIYDVFTKKALSGNPLAVVFESDGLDDKTMLAITREFNLSETVFVGPASNPAHSASLRIFMPGGELPFAGHPTVGAAIAIAERDANTLDTKLMVLEEKIGPVRTMVRMGKGAPFAEFDLPRLPEQQDTPLDAAAAAIALGISPEQIGFENHRISCWSVGMPFVCIPVRNLGIAQQARFDMAAWLANFEEAEPLDVLCPYVYCRETVGHENAFHVRMFAPHHGIPEDPATGSAAAAFAGAIAHFDGLTNGPVALIIEQGVEMGRPSEIRLELEGRGGAIEVARIGGHAVKVAEGVLLS
jgi:trans-2,3-dihydro-3-hydroxyanthranilate isomerase